MIELTAHALLLLGAFFVLVGSIGVWRFEDAYLRLQAASKSLTFGFGAVVLGAGLLTGDAAIFAKACLAVAFQFLTAPIAAQMIARAALSKGLVPAKLREEAPPINTSSSNP